MKMSRVPTSLTAACIAAFKAKVRVKTGTTVPATGEGAASAPSLNRHIIGAFRSGKRFASRGTLMLVATRTEQTLNGPAFVAAPWSP